MAKAIQLPINDAEIRTLNMGDQVLISGVMVTGRDAVHKWLHDNFISGKKTPTAEDSAVLEKLRRITQDGFLYHCGPVVGKNPDGSWKFISSGPTTSIREEPYQASVIELLGLRGVIGKGGMGARTLEACRKFGAVYLHAVGGAAPYIAETVQRVLDVYKLDLGVPEALWVIEVKDFPAMVTMDAHGDNWHKIMRDKSRLKYAEIFPETS